MLKSYALGPAIGLILGFVMVWWIRPDTNAGAVFIVIATTLICFVLGTIITFVSGLLGKRS